MPREDKKRKNRGWVPYGYRYLGPGNDLHRGLPTNPSDKAAQKHDWKYHFLEQQGKRPKWEYSNADDDFIAETENDIGGFIGRNIFKIKRKAAELGLIKDLRPSQRLKYSVPEDWRKFGAKRLTSKAIPELVTQTASVLKMPDGTGSGLNMGVHETSVDEVMNVSRGPPDYTFSSLPFVKDTFIEDQRTAADYTFRMTSPYDADVATTTQDVNAGAGLNTIRTADADSSDASATKARWFDYYASMYKYYHVIGAKWHLMVENIGNVPVYCHQFYHNDTLPPIGATNEDIQFWLGVNTEYIGTHGQAIKAEGVERLENPATTAAQDETMVPETGGNENFETTNMITSKGKGPLLMMNGRYSPGQFKREIRTDSEVENWTLTTANPTLTERCTFRFKPDHNAWTENSTTTTDLPIRLRFKFTIEYLVEFKELKDGLRWPVSRQPLTVTIVANTTSATA